MSFFSLVIKNLFRQPVRAGLTLLGIGIGITTVIALGVITSGMKSTIGDIINLGGANFMVAQKGAADLSFSTVPEEDQSKLAAFPGVERAFGVLMSITRVGANPYFALFGMRPADMAVAAPPLREGRLPAAESTNEAILGSGAAAALDAGLGDTVRISDHDFTVVGVYNAAGVWERNGGYAPLAAVQEATSKPGVVSVIYVVAKAGVDSEQLKLEIEARFPTLAGISSVGETGDVDQGIALLDAANLAISILAVGIGAIGVMNTMMMSVFERTREIGILRAVGWSGVRVMRMVITESLVLCVGAAAFGAAFGVGATRLLLLVPAIKNIVEPQYTADIFVRGLVVAVVVALAGAAYPTYRAVRLTPMEALRYE